MKSDIIRAVSLVSHKEAFGRVLGIRQGLPSEQLLFLQAVLCGNTGFATNEPFVPYGDPTLFLENRVKPD